MRDSFHEKITFNCMVDKKSLQKEIYYASRDSAESYASRDSKESYALR